MQGRRADHSGVDTTIDRPAARRLAGVWDDAIAGWPEVAGPRPVAEEQPFMRQASGVRWPRITGMAAFLAASVLVAWGAGRTLPGRPEHGAVIRGSLPRTGALARRDPTGDVPMKFQAATVIAGAAMAAGANAQQAVQWRTEDGGNGHWYAVTDAVVNWSAARTRAADVGGHLATIASADENAFAAAVAIGENVAYIGAQQLPGSPEPFGGWTWITGEPWSYQSWHFNMDDAPCGYSSGPGEQQQLWMHTAVRQWDDINDVDFPSCALILKRGIIEWSADCDSDGIVDYGQILRGERPDANANGVPDGCECFADLNSDGYVQGADLGLVLAAWGAAPAGTAADINRDGAVDGTDLGLLLATWGACGG
jgi:hypothetical protein